MSESKHPASILVVEDNLTTSRTLLLFLNSQGYRSVCASNGRDAIAKFERDHFDIVILDLMLPDMDGIQVCQKIRQACDTPILILSAKSTEDEIVAGLESGADDYVCKPFGSKELLARVRRCLRRNMKKTGASGCWQVGALVVDGNRRSVTMGGQRVKTTKSEFEIIRVLIGSPGRVFTRDQLIRRVFGNRFSGGDRTIDTHIWSLRKKLGEPPGNPRYVLSEQGVGYRMSDDHGI